VVNPQFAYRQPGRQCLTFVIAWPLTAVKASRRSRPWAVYLVGFTAAGRLTW